MSSGNGNGKAKTVDLSVNCGGIKSPNPFWLASAPPANSGDQVMRAFDAGWGGAVWKTLGDPIVNVSSRYGGIDIGNAKLMGLNNIELITDRPLEDNLREIALCKKRYPNHAVIASLMVETKEQWKEIIKRTQDTGCDGFELNFGCPHGMCERGMGSAVGQEPAVCQEITSWAKEYSKLPVLVKLTPNIGDVTEPGIAAAKGGADGLSLINTIKSLMGVDIDKMVAYPRVGNKSTNGGYCGPAVKPIALYMVEQIYSHPEIKLPISGIGGVSNWRDCVEFILMGSTSVQVCTAVMHYGYRIVEDMIEGVTNYMKEKGFSKVSDFVGLASKNTTDWGNLDLNYSVKAVIDNNKCIGCQLCHVACWDGAHQCIHLQPGTRVPTVDHHECIGCNLCALVCPVPECITMKEVDTGKSPMSWNEFVAQQARKG
jgi:dihydropyrimidine dehydrogenase (NAD+) subunit PreA